MDAKKGRLSFVCSHCGHKEPKWSGKCPECGGWNTFREVTPAKHADGGNVSLPITAIPAQEGGRLSTGLDELDRVLGGGLVRASCILIGGEPGIGKSTLLLQMCSKARTQGRILYVSGEESASQIRMRADRISALSDRVEVFCTHRLSEVLTCLENLKPTIVVVDSIQTIESAEATGTSGTVSQIRHCTNELSAWGKAHDAVIFFAAHVTKEGVIAGPKSAEHLVDVVLSFEQGDNDIRLLRARKNRFGSSDEIGLFIMEEQGFAEIADPSHMFLVQRPGTIPAGVAIAPVLEGSRILLVEIQALTVPAKAGLTRVYSDKIESGRVARIAAILEKHLSLRFSDQDIYINVAGGIKISEPGIDLAVGMALFSARTLLSVPAHTAVVGELSLAGELRAVRKLKSRHKTCESLGYESLCGPNTEEDLPHYSSASTLGQAVEKVFGKTGMHAAQQD